MSFFPFFRAHQRLPPPATRLQVQKRRDLRYRDMGLADRLVILGYDYGPFG